MADEAPKQPAAARRLPVTPPRMSKAEWNRRSHTSVTLTRGELEQLAQLIRAGHAMLNDGRPVSVNLRAAMSRIGLSTHGL